MKSAAALVLDAGPADAGTRVADEALASLRDVAPTLGVLFATPHYSTVAEDLLGAVREVTGEMPLVGCTASSVIGGPREVGTDPGVSLWLAEGTGPAETFSMDYLQEPSGGLPAALLFTCNGRGARLFEAPDHDAGLVAKFLGEIPMAGCFCAGEPGPIGGKNFLHSFTASIAIFRQGRESHG